MLSSVLKPQDPYSQIANSKPSDLANAHVVAPRPWRPGVPSPREEDETQTHKRDALHKHEPGRERSVQKKYKLFVNHLQQKSINH